jgi:DNA end-binding protein Ku
MAPRANWKGFLRLSLVTCPVALYPATSESEKISFNQLNRKTGHRIKYAKVDADTGEEVANEDIVKGYKVDTDTFVEVSKEELENVALESTRTIEIDEFVDRTEIDPRYLIRPTTCVRTARSATTPSRSSAKQSGRWARSRSAAWC